MKNTEYSKRLVTQIKILFILIIIASLIFAWKGKDTSVFVYMIPSTAGIFGAGVIFYLNKSKMENIFKGRTELMKIKFNMIQEHPERKEEIENEISKMDESLNMKIDQEMNEAVQEDITIQNH